MINILQDEMAKNLDSSGDLAPPWSRFPEIERHSIGWRMGFGESWLDMWWRFLGKIEGYEARLAYLRRHPKAPYSWSDLVHGVLFPFEEENDGDEEEETSAIQACLVLEVVESDIAYQTWLAQQQEIHWPWTLQTDPLNAVRYWTRALWFWSRQWSTLRNQGVALPSPKGEWAAFLPALAGETLPFAPKNGLHALLAMLCEGEVRSPWRLGLSPADFTGSFELNMGYVDAFLLWIMSAFDDQPHFLRYLATQGDPPDSWKAWVNQNVHFV